MVDVLVTTFKHEIRDSKGEVLTDITLSPSKSEARKTTASATSSGVTSSTTNSSSGLSTGAKAGIGASLGIGGAIALLGAGLFILRRRKNRKNSAVRKESVGATDESDGVTSVNNYYKAELATGPDVEAHPPVELPEKSMATPKEVQGDAYPGMDRSPAELPVHEPALELGVPKTGDREGR